MSTNTRVNELKRLRKKDRVTVEDHNGIVEGLQFLYNQKRPPVSTSNLRHRNAQYLATSVSSVPAYSVLQLVEAGWTASWAGVATTEILTVGNVVNSSCHLFTNGSIAIAANSTGWVTPIAIDNVIPLRVDNPTLAQGNALTPAIPKLSSMQLKATTESGSGFSIINAHSDTGVFWCIRQVAQPRVRLCVTNEVIQPGQSGAVTIWDSSVSPPVETTETVEGVVLDWMHGDKAISEGKRAGILEAKGINRFMWAECE